MTRNHRQEALCRAYVQAIAAAAGLGYSIPSPDYGIDVSLRYIEEVGNRRHDASYQIDVQLKSSTRAAVTRESVSFDLDIATYESLRSEHTGVPRILIVLVMPENESDWLEQSSKQLALRNCAYWLSLKGAATLPARRSVQVAIPVANVFSPDSARELLLRIRERRDL